MERDMGNARFEMTLSKPVSAQHIKIMVQTFSAVTSGPIIQIRAGLLV
jgi:hypothetical protein